MSDPVVEKEPGPAPEQSGSGTPPADEKKKREYKEFGHEEEGPTRE
jgi:H+-transporting ATPase